MNKFFKVAGIWVSMFIVTVILAGVFASLGLDWLAKITIATLAGHAYLMGLSLFFAYIYGEPLSKLVWWAVVIHVLTCSIVDERDWVFGIGPIIGIAVCYWLMKKSGDILSSHGRLA